MLRSAVFKRSFRIYRAVYSRQRDIELERISSKLSVEMSKLEEMTSKVAKVIREADLKKSQQTKKELGKPDTQHDVILNDEDFGTVLKGLDLDDPVQSLEFKDSLNIQLKLDSSKELLSLFPKPKSYVPLPTIIEDMIPANIISNIANKDEANWRPVVENLLLQVKKLGNDPNEIILNEFGAQEFHHFYKCIPKENKGEVVDLLHELAIETRALWHTTEGEDNVIHNFVLNDLIASCAYLPVEKADIIVNKLLEEIKIETLPDGLNENIQHTGSIVATVSTKCILLNHYARMANIEKVKIYLNDLRKLPNNINPLNNSPIIYTSIMQMYTRLGNYELTKETFDTMKFLSVKTAPSSRTCTSMILMDTLNNNIEHGLEVYENMQKENFQIESSALLALAKGCAIRGTIDNGGSDTLGNNYGRVMIRKGWDFIMKYYSQGHEINEQVLEIMMYLTYKDADLAFARSLWLSVCENRTKSKGLPDVSDGKMIKWLFNTYYRMGDVLDREKKKIKLNLKNHKPWMPVSVEDEKVRLIRSKVLDMVKFDYHVSAPPLLPLTNFTGSDSKMILQEANAVWKYLCTNFPHVISSEIVEAYLYVLGRYGSIEEFKRAWEELTVAEQQDLQMGKVTIEEPEKPIQAELKLEGEETENSQRNLTLNKPRVPRLQRTDRLYTMCLHISRHQHDLAFGQQIWQERGVYRHSQQFQDLTKTCQDRQDFKFARLMLSLLVSVGQAGDAYALVLSSKSRFRWSKYHLKSLIQLCQKLGLSTMERELWKVIR
ncbi:hypothetical protein DAMA08_043290 [Martiniozyma asiatica (nom. inval.)]|nr:hypothetical protein DAMA08_043290 [Martiniozyma asiatica]